MELGIVSFWLAISNDFLCSGIVSTASLWKTGQVYLLNYDPSLPYFAIYSYVPSNKQNSKYAWFPQVWFLVTESVSTGHKTLFYVLEQ